MQFPINICFGIIFQISYFVLCLMKTSAANDRLSQDQLFNDSTSLVSAGNKFKLRFFTPGNSGNRYLGIWYIDIPAQTVVWIANRNSPLNDSSGILKIGNDGNLIIQNSQGIVAWSTNVLNISAKGTVAQLLDSGNLVLKYGNDFISSQSYLWQSFDHPTDTFLPGMKLGWDFAIGLNRYLTSWKSNEDPSPGEFFFGFDPDVYPQLILRKGSAKISRSGPYDFQVSNGTLVRTNPYYKIKFIFTPQELYIEFDNYGDYLSTAVLTYAGEFQRYVWDKKSLEWLSIGTHPGDPCDYYNNCGPNAICTTNTPQPCLCLTGYRPKFSEGNDTSVSSNGCVRKAPLNCPVNEGFIEMTGIRIPDVLKVNMYSNMSLDECRKECLKNCSCTAFSNGEPSGDDSSNCLLWYNDLFDLRRSVNYNLLSFYVRATAEDLDSLSYSKKKKYLKIVMITITVTSAILIGTLFVRCWKKIYRKEEKSETRSTGMQELDLATFEMSVIAEATNSFSDSNKIGEGGFGPVYEGQLATGQKIAVKRLSLNSKQGLIELKNEVILISKLQHRNLVRLLGCCICGEERMLIYEYMANKSLDNHIYDCKTRKVLNWRRRFDVIIGIARGLLYLHRDSRLRIIHRDLKASNVLLDGEMNPKISDFGIARAFKEKQHLGKTTRVIGTHGYMAPEYVTKGLYSMKSDVFSFGVLLLEIISGRKNRDFHHSDHDLNLSGHAWKLWTEGNAYQLIDELMEGQFPISEVERCIHAGLLCVQRRPEDRPAMSTVLLMLDGNNTLLPQPNQPAFCHTEKSMDNTEDLQSTNRPTNDITLTVLEGR